MKSTQEKPLQLVIVGNHWEPAMRRLLMEQGLWASGSLRWNETSTVSYLLVDNLTVDVQPPTGQSRPPLSDWLAVRLVDGNPQAHAHDAIEVLAPGASQQLAILLLDRQDYRHWCAALWRQGQLEPIRSLEILGGGTLRLGEAVRPECDDDPQATLRWSRTIGALGQDVWTKIRQARVAIIGSGRNASVLAYQLAALGAGQLCLIDPDILGLENLDGMPGLSVSDVGKPKVFALAKRLHEFRPDLALSCLPMSATDPKVAELLRDRPDLLVTAVDGDTPRLAASLLSRRWLIPHCDVATAIMRSRGDVAHAPGDSPDAQIEDTRDDDESTTEIWGDVRLFIPNQPGCCACVPGLVDREQTLYELAAPSGVLQRGVPIPWHRERAGSLITINSMCVSVAVQAWLDVLSGATRTSQWHRLRWLQGEGLQATTRTIVPEGPCPFCT